MSLICISTLAYNDHLHSFCPRSRDWGYCLEDEPSDHEFDFPVLPPGVMYDIDHQCRLQYGPEAGYCEGIDVSSFYHFEIPLLYFPIIWNILYQARSGLCFSYPVFSSFKLRVMFFVYLYMNYNGVGPNLLNDNLQRLHALIFKICYNNDNTTSLYLCYTTVLYSSTIPLRVGYNCNCQL